MKLKWALVAIVFAGLAWRPMHTRADDGDGTSDPNAVAALAPGELTAADVDMAIKAAAASVNNPNMVIAVTNRSGQVLAIFKKPSAPNTATANFGNTADSVEVAVNLARTASFFSNARAPLSSRTVRTISGVHFPPGVMFTGQAALYGIENTNRGCTLSTNYIPGQEIPQSLSVDRTAPGQGVLTGKPDLIDSDSTKLNPGGSPLFKNVAAATVDDPNYLAGGIGIAGVPGPVAEFAAANGLLALAGVYGVPVLPFPGRVLIDGIELPFLDQLTQPPGTTPDSATGGALGSYIPFTDTKPAYTGPILAPGVTIDPKFKVTTYTGPRDSPGPVPDGYLVAATNGPLGGLSQADVQTIIQNTLDTANQTRALIRLPAGVKARFIIAVADLDGTIIGMFRMKDATIFSIDVAATKARNVIFFSGPNRLACTTFKRPDFFTIPTAITCDLPTVPKGTAMTNRSIEFGSEPFFPPGIDYGSTGAFFDLYKYDVGHPCTQGSDTFSPAINRSGIVFFPGALPLYRNGVMIGGLGVSGDGVEQDDFATAGGAVGFEAPAKIRADTVFVDGVRLPYIKFPRNPTD